MVIRKILLGSAMAVLAAWSAAGAATLDDVKGRNVVRCGTAHRARDERRAADMTKL